MVKLAGKILRLADNDPRRFTTYLPGTGKVRMKGATRVGRPRQNWGQITHERIWEHIREDVGQEQEVGDPLDAEQTEWIRDAATMGMY